MRIYYDETRKNIVLGATNRLFATGSLIASIDRGRVAVIYRSNNFRELFIRHEKVLKEDGSPAGATLQDVISYLNEEFNRSPFDEIKPSGGASSVPTIVPSGSVFSVPVNTQVLFSEEIELDGELELDGILVEVN